MTWRAWLKISPGDENIIEKYYFDVYYTYTVLIDDYCSRRKVVIGSEINFF